MAAGKGEGKGGAVSAPPDRPGWTAAWSDKHQAWYWWNSLMQTTWDDPETGEPRIVPSRLVKQPTVGRASAGQGVTQQQVDALPHVHSQLGDLNVLPMKALRAICVTRGLATRGRRVDLVCRLIGHDVSLSASGSTVWRTTGHTRVGQRVCRERPKAAAEPDAKASPAAAAEPRAEASPAAKAAEASPAAKDAEQDAGSSADASATTKPDGPVRGAVTAWRPATADDAEQFYVVLHDGGEEVLTDAEVEEAAAEYQAANGGEKQGAKRGRHGERAQARDGLEDVRLGKWSVTEIGKLDKAMTEVGAEDWHALSARVGSRSHLQVYDFQRRRQEAAKKRREDEAALQLLVERYMADHGLTDFDPVGLGITPSSVSQSMMSWLSSTYGEQQATSLAIKLRRTLYSQQKPDAETPGQAEGDGAAEDSTEDAGAAAPQRRKFTRKRIRRDVKGRPWTTAEERYLQQLVQEDNESSAKKWEAKASALGTERTGNSVHQRWKLIQLGGGVLEGDGSVSRSWPTGTPTFVPDSATSSSAASRGTKPGKKTADTSVLETDLVDVNCYKIDAGKEYEIRITAEKNPRFAVCDLVKIVCNLDVQDTVAAGEKEQLLAWVPDIARCASRRNRSQSWLATDWSYVDRVLAFCADIRAEAHAIEAERFRSTTAFTLIEKLITALKQDGPLHPFACELRLETEPPPGAGVNGNGTSAGLPGEAEFRGDLKRMCRDRTLVGQRLSVYWGGDQNWYSGTVIECRKGKEFKVVYDDGEVSWESVEMQIGVRFLAGANKRSPKPAPAAAKAAAAKKTRKVKAVTEEIQEWRVLKFINSEPYEPSDIRLTGEKPPRIALRDFLECVLDVESGTETKQKQVVKQLRKNLRKNVVLEYIFVDERGEEDQTEVVALTELGKIFPLLPSNLTNRVRETGDLHRLQKMLRQESGIAGIEMSVDAPGPGPVLQPLEASRGGRGAGKIGKAAAHVNLEEWQEMWSPVLCLPSDGTRDRVAAAARNSDPYVDPAPASLRLESRQLMNQASGNASLPGATSRHPGYIRLPCAPTAELRWLCTTGNLTGRRVSVYWPKDDLWYDGTVDQCQPGRFKLTYDSESTESGANATVRWEILGIGVHLLSRLPVGETMRKMFVTRSRLVTGRGRSVHTAPRLKHRQSAAIACPPSTSPMAETDIMGDDESELEPTALAMLMAPPFRVEGSPGSSKKHTVEDENTEAAGDVSWTPKEEALLRQVVISMGTGRWEAKVAAMKSKRSWMALALRYGSMVRRQKNDPLLKRGFRLFSASPSTQEVKAARSALGLAIPLKACEACGASHDGTYGSGRFCSIGCKNKRFYTRSVRTCEACGASHDGTYGSGRFCSIGCKNKRSATQLVRPDRVKLCEKTCEGCLVKNDGSYGSGRFCSESCKNRHSNRSRQNVVTTAAPTNRSKRFRRASNPQTDDKHEESDESSEDADEARQCQQCGEDLAPPFFGSGRFCSQVCGARFSKSVYDKRFNESRGDSSSSESDVEGEQSDQDHSDDGGGGGGGGDSRQCQTCRRELSRPLYGAGRFCDNKCAARWSRVRVGPKPTIRPVGSKSPSREDSAGALLLSVRSDMITNTKHAQAPTPVARSASVSRRRRS